MSGAKRTRDEGQDPKTSRDDPTANGTPVPDDPDAEHDDPEPAGEVGGVGGTRGPDGSAGIGDDPPIDSGVKIAVGLFPV